MNAEQFHRAKLKEIGYKDEVIETFVNKFLDNSTYEFAEKYHQSKLKNNGDLGDVSDFSNDEVNQIRQWFDFVQDVGGSNFTDKEYLLAKKIYEKLSMRVPNSINDNCR